MVSADFGLFVGLNFGLGGDLGFGLLGVGLGFCFGAVGLPWVLGEHSEEENRNEEREKRNEEREKKVKIK